MGRDDSSRPGVPRGFEHPGRSLTPISARKIVTSGASEIVVDDFIDTYLRERPKTIPEMSLHQPPEPPEPATKIKAPSTRPSRATRRGLGPNASSSAASPPTAPPVEAPETIVDAPRDTLPHGDVDESVAKHLLAVRDERISQLEEELKKVKSDLEAARRPSEPDIEPRTQMFQASPASPSGAPVSVPSAAPAQVWRPAAPPRPVAAPAVRPTVKTVPMAAVARAPVAAPPVPPPPPGRAEPEGGGTMIIPSVVAPPSPARPVAPSATPSPPSALSTQPRAAAADEPAPTMVLDRVPDVLASGSTSSPATATATGFASAPSSPPPAGSSGLTPAPFTAPTADEPTPFAAVPPASDGVAPRRSRASLVLALVAIVGAGAAGSFAYLRGLGPFARAASPVESAVRAAKTAPTPIASSSPAASASSAPAPLSEGSDRPSASSAAAAPDSPAPVSSSSRETPAPSASPTPAQPEAPRATADELKTLLSFQAFLTVQSSLDATVVVQGQEVGRTNQRLVVRCGPKNVRLRGAGAEWVSDGVAAQITCMEHTVVGLEPSR